MAFSFLYAVVHVASLQAVFTWPYICAQAFAGVIAIVVWRKYFYNISDVPGPFLASFTLLWHLVRIFIGDQNLRMIELHDKHGVSVPKRHSTVTCLTNDPFIAGHFVRIADDEVSVSHPEAVRKLLLAPVPKVRLCPPAYLMAYHRLIIIIKGYWYSGTTIPDYSYIAPMSICDPKAKIALSKALSPGYSQSMQFTLLYDNYVLADRGEDNVLQYEPSITRTIDGSLDWVEKYSQSKAPLSLDEFFAYTTFNVIGEVVFAKPFGFLEKGTDIGNSVAQSSNFRKG